MRCILPPVTQHYHESEPCFLRRLLIALHDALVTRCDGWSAHITGAPADYKPIPGSYCDIRKHLLRDNESKTEGSAGPSSDWRDGKRKAAVAARSKIEEQSPKKRRSCGIPGCCKDDPMRT